MSLFTNESPPITDEEVKTLAEFLHFKYCMCEVNLFWCCFYSNEFMQSKTRRDLEVIFAAYYQFMEDGPVDGMKATEACMGDLNDGNLRPRLETLLPRHRPFLLWCYRVLCKRSWSDDQWKAFLEKDPDLIRHYRSP